MNVQRLFFLSGCVLFMSVSVVFAQETIDRQLIDEIRSLRKTVESQQTRIDELERHLLKQTESSGQNDLDSRIDAKSEEKFPALKVMEDLQMGIGSTMIIQGTHNANGDTQSPKEDVLDSSYSMDLTFLKKFDDYGQGFVHLEQGNGQGVEDELKVFSNVNRDADDDNNVRATEVWYEHYLNPQGVPLTITFGKLDPTAYIDDNAYANDEAAQFLGRIFRNSPVIEFPDNAGGIRMGYAFGERIEINAVSLDADTDWEDTFDGMFHTAQINIKPGFLNREGNYRFLAWFNGQNHTKWLDATKDKEKGYGLGISFDQELNDTTGVFFRWGWQNPEVYLNAASDFSLEQSYSLGAQLKGTGWNRENDTLGIAFGQIFASGDYKNSGSELKTNPENHLECYYSYKVNEHLSISPDLHVIWNPYGDDAVNGTSTIVVGGMRVQMDF